MKKLLLLCACLTILLSCSNQKSTKEPELTSEDAAIGILQLYQNVESQLVAEQNGFYQLLLTPTREANGRDNGYFLRNIAHIDSVVNQATALVKENKVSELLALLESELPNFYAHPHNTINNEIMLHQLLVALYRQTSKSYEEYVSKILPLNDWTIMHIEALENKHPYYNSILIEQICYYMDLGQYDEAIICGEKLSAYMKQTTDEEGQVCASLFLARAYEKAGMPTLKDSAINSVKNHPQYAKCREEVNAIFED